MFSTEFVVMTRLASVWEICFKKKKIVICVVRHEMYGERFGDGVEYHLMNPTPRR